MKFKEYLKEAVKDWNKKLKDQIISYLRKENFKLGKSPKETSKLIKELPDFKNEKFTYIQADSLGLYLHTDTEGRKIAKDFK